MDRELFIIIKTISTLTFLISISNFINILGLLIFYLLIFNRIMHVLIVNKNIMNTNWNGGVKSVSKIYYPFLTKIQYRINQ